MSLVVISHRMEDLARLVERMVVLSHGRVVGDAPIRELLHRTEWLGDHGLEAPALSRLSARWAQEGLSLEPAPLTVSEAEMVLRGRLCLG